MGVVPVSRDVQKLGQTSESEKNAARPKHNQGGVKIWTYYVLLDVSGFYIDDSEYVVAIV